MLVSTTVETCNTVVVAYAVNWLFDMLTLVIVAVAVTTVVGSTGRVPVSVIVAEIVADRVTVTGVAPMVIASVNALGVVRVSVTVRIAHEIGVSEGRHEALAVTVRILVVIPNTLVVDVIVPALGTVTVEVVPSGGLHDGVLVKVSV